MAIVHSIIGQLCLRGRCVGGIHDTYKRAHHVTVRVQKLALREGYASAARAIPRTEHQPPPSPKNTTHRIHLPPSSCHSFSLSVSPLSRLRVIPARGRFPARLPSLLFAPRVTLRLITFYVSPFSFFPFLVFFFFWFFALFLEEERPTDWAPLSCADRAFLNYARFMRGQRAFALGSVEWRDSDKGTSTTVKGESRV